MNNKLISLSKISEDKVFFSGVEFRFYYNNKKYYDYILAHLPWMNDEMLLINITPNSPKKGYAYGGTVACVSEFVAAVNINGLKYTLGEKELDKWFLKEYVE